MDRSAWEEAGIYDPAAAAAPERLELLEYLTRQGAGLDQMVEAMRLDSLPALAGQLLRLRSTPRVPIGVLATRCGATVEMVERLMLAAGLPADATSELPADMDALVSAFVSGAALMGEGPVLAFTRVLGSAAIQVAESAVALFYSELGPGTDRAPHSELARAHMSERATLAFNAVPEAFSRLLVAQFDRAVRRAVLTRGPAYSAEGEEFDSDRERVALGFVDLVGSTAWANQIDLREQSLALARFESAAWSSAVLAGGRVVKMIGDEAFFAAPSVEAACRIATEVTAAVADDPVLPPARGAVGFGAAGSREGDYFGPVVNLVSRLVKSARPGAVLLTAEAAAELPAEGFSLRSIDELAVRGLDHPVAAFELGVEGS